MADTKVRVPSIRDMDAETFAPSPALRPSRPPDCLPLDSLRAHRRPLPAVRSTLCAASRLLRYPGAYGGSSRQLLRPTDRYIRDPARARSGFRPFRSAPHDIARPMG